MSSTRWDKKKMRSNIREQAARQGNKAFQSEDRFFYEMLMINFASKKAKYEDIRERYKEIEQNDVVEEWNVLDGQLRMLVEELKIYIEMADDFREVEILGKKAKEELRNQQDKKSKLEKSEKESVGFFNKMSKEEKLGEYDDFIKKFERRVGIFQRVVGLLGHVMVEEQLTVIKARKNIRFEGAIKRFSEKMVKDLKDKKAFWESITAQEAQQPTNQQPTEDTEDIAEESHSEEIKETK